MRKTHLFVMSLPFSSYVYTEFVFTQKTPRDFIAAHEKAFASLVGLLAMLFVTTSKLWLQRHTYMTL